MTGYLYLKEGILSDSRAPGITEALETGLAGFLQDTFNDFDHFAQYIEISVTSVVHPMSEDHVSTEKKINDTDSDDEYLEHESSFEPL